MRPDKRARRPRKPEPEELSEEVEDLIETGEDSDGDVDATDDVSADDVSSDDVSEEAESVDEDKSDDDAASAASSAGEFEEDSDVDMAAAGTSPVRLTKVSLAELVGELKLAFGVGGEKRRKAEVRSEDIVTCLRLCDSAIRSSFTLGAMNASEKGSNVSSKSQKKVQTINRHHKFQEAVMDLVLSAAYRFDADVEDLEGVVYDSLELVGRLRSEVLSEACVRSAFVQVWKDMSVLTQTCRSSHPIVKAFLLSVSEGVMMESLWMVPPKTILSLWKSLVNAVIVCCTKSFCPPMFAAMYKSFVHAKQVAEAARPGLLVQLLRQTFKAIRTHFAVRKAREAVIDKARYFCLTYSAVLSELQQAGFRAQVYDACLFSLQELVLATGLFMSSQSNMAKAKERRKKQEQKLAMLQSVVLSWATIFQCSIYVCVMTLENGVENGAVDVAGLAEGVAPLLLVLNRHCKGRPSLLPLRVKLLSLCLQLMTATGKHVPVGYAICEVGAEVASLTAAAGGKKGGVETKLLRPVNLKTALSAGRLQTGQPQFQEEMRRAFQDLLVNYLTLVANHPSFPETSAAVLAAVHKLGLPLKQLIPVVQETAAQVSAWRRATRAAAQLRAPTLFVVPAQVYADLQLIKFARQRPVNDVISAIL